MVASGLLRMLERRHEWRRGTHECVRYNRTAVVEFAALGRNNPGSWREGAAGEMLYCGLRWLLLLKPLPFRHRKRRAGSLRNRKLLH